MLLFVKEFPFAMDLVPHVARGRMSCVMQAKRHARWRCSGPARALNMLTDLDRVREHALDAIEPRDQCDAPGFQLTLIVG
jgi:hypothetical protein